MKTLSLMCTLILAFQISPSQEHKTVDQEARNQAFPFMGNNSPVPDGYTFRCAAGYPVYGDDRMPVIGRFSLGLAGVLELGYSNEGYIGNPIGMTRPANSWDAKIQIFKQREELPSVALWARGTIGWQNEDLGAYALWAVLPSFFNFGVVGTRYEFSSMTVGLSMAPGLGKWITMNLSVGYQELSSRNLWILIAPAPIIGNGYHAVSGDRSGMLEASANIVAGLLPQLALVAQAGTLPYFNVNPTALTLEVGRAYNGAVGVRYTLPIPLSVDSYVRWQSNINGKTDTQFRLGLSSEIPLL